MEVAELAMLGPIAASWPGRQGRWLARPCSWQGKPPYCQAHYAYASSCTTLLQGRIGSWIKNKVGVDPANLYPSVRCGLEGALLTALAQAHKIPLASLLHRQDAPPPAISAEPTQPPEAVLVNGLLDWCSTIEACTKNAVDMVAQGYSALKIKVCCLMCSSCSAALKQTSWWCRRHMCACKAHGAAQGHKHCKRCASLRQ